MLGSPKNFRPQALPMTAAIMLAGCGPSEPPAEKISPEVWASPHNGPVMHDASTSMDVARGNLPLVYLTNAPGTLRVMDMKSGTLVAVATVGAGQAISVTSGKGVRIGGVAFSDPLPADHQYEMFFEDNNMKIAAPTTAPAR